MAFFRAHQNIWIAAIDLEPVGGRQAWRTRVSEARIEFEDAGEGTIINRQSLQRLGDKRWVLSEYCYQPQATSYQPSAQGHDTNAPWELR
jgi:hypothetical protein